METAAQRVSIAELLSRARVGIDRVTAVEAYRATQAGAVIVDVRSADERRRQGGAIPGALHHPLSVVAWRLDPDCPTSNEKLPLDTHLILLCREGYSSSLAATWLRAIGFERATDLIGGIDAWRAAGLPVAALA